MIFHQPTNSRSNFNYNAFVYNETAYTAHFHSNYELIYVLSGNDTTAQIGGKTCVLRSGEAVLVSPFVVHAFDIPKTSSVWVGVFSQDFVQDFADKYSHIQFQPFSFSEKMAAFLKEYLFSTVQPDLYYLKALLYIACAECQQYADVWQTDETGVQSAVIEYISNHFQEDVSMRQLSKTLGYEYHYFSNLFHRCFNMDFKKFINLLRFEHACYLLGHRDAEITRVCTQCGFSSIRNFNRVFKSLSGMTPMQYKAKKNG